MKTLRNAAGLAALALVLATGAAIGQDSPESLLPPGFDDPVAPAPAPSPATPPAGVTPPVARLAPGASPSPTPSGSATPGVIDPAELAKYELPDFAKRSLDQVGAIDVAGDSMAPGAFGDADGRYLETLMRRLSAPVASRWLSIALRRALLSPLDTPPGVNGADFAAERAWLLLRMGEAHAARGVVQGVDIANYTPKLFQVAMQVGLATSDPGALCPLVEPAQQKGVSDQGWVLARAFCAGLAGDPATAGPLIDAVRRRGVREPIDLLLAEKILGTGAQGRRAVTIEWDGVSRLTAWRYGLATAAGVEVPDALYASTGPQARYWLATAPGVNARLRAPSAELAAAQGVFSNQGLIDLYGEIEEAEDANTAEATIARDLRNAYIAGDFAERIGTMRQLWDEPDTVRGKYARLVLTARAAAGIVPDASRAADAPRLIASMLTAGRDIAAVRWRTVVERGSEGWAMLALADPRRVMVAYGDADAYRGSAAARKAQMLVAGLAGLGRLSEADAEQLAEAAGVRIGAANSWTTAIEQAASRNQPATVLLLAATAMQTRVWNGVPPEAVFHITLALRRVGLEPYARMIAAEAIARL